jgi:tungstate transport system substrate-binding protein
MNLRTFALVIVFCLGAAVSSHPADQRLRLASTTSTDNTGLFAALNPPFETMFNLRVDVIAQGTGKALKTGEMGDCDVVFVHSRSDEDGFVEAGHGVNRRDVMYNDFVIVGPKEDPAGIERTDTPVEAMTKMAVRRHPFISRGDESGTHKKEKTLWEKAGLAPEGLWYIESGQGMGAVLHIADEKRAYTLSDRGTYLAYRRNIDLRILNEGDPLLFNPYGIIAVNPARHPAANYIMAMAYIGWVTSPEGQAIIREFGKDKFGQSLFIPLAVP